MIFTFLLREKVNVIEFVKDKFILKFPKLSFYTHILTSFKLTKYYDG